MTTHDEREPTRDRTAEAKRDTLTRAERFGENGQKAANVIGASSWGVALGVSPYASAVDLWRELTTGIRPYVGNAATELGDDLEDGVARNAARRLGVTALDSPPTLRHPKHRHLVATPDRIVTALGPNAAPGVLVGDLMQVKTTALTTPIRRAHLDEVWGEEGTDEVPEHVLVQCIAELWIARAWATKYPDVWGFPPPVTNHVPALVGGRGVQVFRVSWDPELAEALAARVLDFWRLVIDEEPPPIDESKAWDRELRRQHPRHTAGEWKNADADTAALVRILLEERAALENAAKRADYVANLLKAEIGDAEGLRGPWGRIPWRARAGRSYVQHVPMAGRLLDLARLHRDAHRADLEDARARAVAVMELVDRDLTVSTDVQQAIGRLLDPLLPLGLFDDAPRVPLATPLFDVPDDVDAVLDAFRVTGSPSRAFGPPVVDREVLDLSFPPSPIQEERAELAIAALEEVDRVPEPPAPPPPGAAAPIPVDIVDALYADIEAGRGLDVAKVLALPPADNVAPLVPRGVMERLDRAVDRAVAAGRAEGRPTAKKPPPGPSRAPSMLGRPPGCACARAVLGSSPGSDVVECYACGKSGIPEEPPAVADAWREPEPILDPVAVAAWVAEEPGAPSSYREDGDDTARMAAAAARAAAYPDDDGDQWVITRKNTRPTVQRVFLTPSGQWHPDRNLARRFDDELAATRAKPRQTRVAKLSEVDALDVVDDAPAPATPETMEPTT